MRLLSTFLCMLPLSLTDSALAKDPYVENIEAWRNAQEKDLRADDGWLTVVRLAWLQEGNNSLGSSETAQVRLPSYTPLKLGHIMLKGDQVHIVFDDVTGVTVDGQKAIKKRTYTLVSDVHSHPTQIKVAGKTEFFLLKRANQFAIRVKDADSVARKNFKGRRWYDVNPAFHLQGKWVQLDKPMTLMVPDVLGNQSAEKVSGFVEFHIGSETFKLYPTSTKGSLFFVFRDTTCGKESYGASRFLTTPLPKAGLVDLDFNKAVNPPCAFTHAATCPLPPKENKLNVAIPAGEKKPAA